MYTYEQWKEVKTSLSLTNKKISEIIGTTEDNVRKQLGPSKKLPTWARAMIYANHQKTFISVIDDIVIPKNYSELSGIIGGEKKECDCYIDGAGIFRRGKSKCKLKKDEHAF